MLRRLRGAPGRGRRRHATRLTDLALAAADHAYVLTVERLCEGLEAVLNSYAHAADPAKQRVAALWTAAQAE